jgi:hypothetical protein
MPVLPCGVAHIAELRLPPGGLAIEPTVGVGRTWVSFLRFCPWKSAPPSSSPLPSLGRKLFCDAQASINVPSTEKCSSDNSGLTWGWRRSRVMKFVNTSPFCSRSRFFVKVVRARPDRRGKAPRTTGIRDCSPVVPSAVVPTECRRTPAAAMRSAIAPGGSRGALRWHRAYPNSGSTRSARHEQAPGSSSADGSPEPAPPARLMKTARPDPQKRPACEPPTIRDASLNHHSPA